VGLKTSTVYRLIGLVRFPKQIKLSEHASAWIESEIEDFMLSRIAVRDHQSLSLATSDSPCMRMGEVMKCTDLNSSKIYKLIRKGEFSKWSDFPKIASGWLKSDIETWLATNTGTHS
jgi:prophage regulatory protein